MPNGNACDMGMIWARVAAPPPPRPRPRSLASWLLVFKLLAFRRNDPRCFVLGGCWRRQNENRARRPVRVDRAGSSLGAATRRVAAGLIRSARPVPSCAGTLGAETGDQHQTLHARRRTDELPDILRRSARRPAPGPVGPDRGFGLRGRAAPGRHRAVAQSRRRRGHVVL